MTFAQKCKYYRTKMNLTQTKVAELTGISKRTYLYYEQGEKMPRKRDTIQKLADCFGIDINQLIVEDDAIWSQLQRQRPIQERTNELLQEIQYLLAEKDVPEILTFAKEASAMCAAYMANSETSSE